MSMNVCICSGKNEETTRIVLKSASLRVWQPFHSSGWNYNADAPDSQWGDQLNHILFNEAKYKNQCCGRHYPLYNRTSWMAATVPQKRVFDPKELKRSLQCRSIKWPPKRRGRRSHHMDRTSEDWSAAGLLLWVQRSAWSNTWPSDGETDTCDIWWRSVMIWGCFSEAGAKQMCLCEGRMNREQRCPGRKPASSCSDDVPQLWGVVCSSNASCHTHTHSVDEGPGHGPISRPESYWKHLECGQEEDGWSQAIKRSRVPRQQSERLVESQDAWKLGFKIQVIPPNIDLWTPPKLFSLHYLRSEITASFSLFWPVVVLCK